MLQTKKKSHNILSHKKMLSYNTMQSVDKMFLDNILFLSENIYQLNNMLFEI
jgi:hypothetical protein